MYCHNCGTEIPEDSLYCPLCGVRVGRPQQGRAAPDAAPRVSSDRKAGGRSLGLALLLSVIIPGLGQVYMGKVPRAAFFLILALLLPLPFNVIAWLVNIIDVYMLAKKER